jgi:hypothetical protein
MKIYVYAEHTTLAGQVYTGENNWTDSDDLRSFATGTRDEMVFLAAVTASRGGAVNAFDAKCGRSILEHLDVADEWVTMGIIEDLELEIGAASIELCRGVCDAANGDTLSPQTMVMYTSNPRNHTYTSLRSALIMLGCVEREGSDQ